MTGKTISHYKILDKLGEGGMGVVYKARDSHLDRFVAVKVLPPEKVVDPLRKMRFVREAKSASALNHPNIITIYDIDEQDGVDFIVMEFVDGKTLEELIGREGLAVDESLKYAVQIADALAAAHEADIIHRDLKPGNVMVTGKGLVKVLDFGLAKLTEQPVGESDNTVTFQAETAADAIVGTPAYMSPEQVERKPLDTRSDIFSFGVVLYEILTGRRAFRRKTVISTMTAILREEPKPVSETMKDVPLELDKIVARCLRKDRGRRSQHMADVKLALEEVQRPSPQRPDSRPSVAVLPFVNMNRDEESEFFCDGITEDIINALTKVEGLRVAARSTSFQFKGESPKVREVGESLGVSAVLEGSVRRVGKRLRITTELVSVADGFQMWSERYDRVMEDIFDIQDEISRAIVETLKVKLVGEQKEQIVKRYTGNIEAYNLYLKGRFYWN